MAEKLSTAQQTVIDRMAAGDALTRGVSSRRAYVGSGNTRRMVAFFNMNALQDRGLIERCDRIGQPFITWCLTDAGHALITTAQPTEGEMAENTYTITAKDAAENRELWAQVARGEVEVRDSDGDTVLKSLKKKTERGNTVYEPFTIAMDTDGERNEYPVLYHSDEVLTVHRLQPPTDTPPGEPPAEDGTAVYVKAYVNALIAERDDLAQVAARAERAEAANRELNDVVARVRQWMQARGYDVLLNEWKREAREATRGEPLADDGDAKTEDGG